MIKSKSLSEKAKKFLNGWENDPAFKTVARSFVSMFITMLFAIYNGYLGLSLSSVWHGSICVFYLFLVVIRAIILLAERENTKRKAEQRAFCRRRAYIVSCVLLFVMDISLIVPISMMVLMQKPVDIGLIPAIAMAAYTTYKITIASVRIRQTRKSVSGNLLITELRIIDFIDAMVSILTLQNTLIMVKQTSPGSGDMLILTAVSSAVIYGAIVIITVVMLIRALRKN